MPITKPVIVRAIVISTVFWILAGSVVWTTRWAMRLIASAPRLHEPVKGSKPVARPYQINDVSNCLASSVGGASSNASQFIPETFMRISGNNFSPKPLTLNGCKQRLLLDLPNSIVLIFWRAISLGKKVIGFVLSILNLWATLQLDCAGSLRHRYG